MGKTPKSKNVNRGRSSFQPKVMQHKPLISGKGRMTFPDISQKSAPPIRRMKLSGTLSRKSSHGKGVIIKVFSSSIAEQSTGASRIPRMSVVASETSESIAANHQPELILENGKEDVQAPGEVMSLKERPIANGTESEVTDQSQPETVDVDENPGKPAKEANAVHEPVGNADSAASVKLMKDDEGEPKKRSGTPQSRSSTPQRKSGRVRSKHDSPNKTTASTTLTPGLKVLKINMTPGKTLTNGTVEDKSRAECDSTKGKSVKSAESESFKLVETNSVVENAVGVLTPEEASDNAEVDGESSKPSPTNVNAPYLRSLRMVSGRRSLTSNSPSKSLPILSPSSTTAASPQWRKRQSRKKEAASLKDDSEQQGSGNELNSSVSSGKRKADSSDEQSVPFTAGNVKKSKNEDDDIKLFLSDESEDNHLENESDEFFNSSQFSKSSDDVMAELKDLNESTSSDVQFSKNESMEYAYEAKEVETCEKLHESSTAANESSTKRWCILM
ncbi:uncharacterized protein LOC124154229 isoform X2 [Ischnura elegans]|uniref:uncharacterized protein LOC124154229 isoform X2 n=1 Tax=Ischnura elegans TaxID=197161 RepID=UPI001ED89316|nr:uncharacterized protein LOC124154229 isoform X2 [Ischnura elegans]